MPDQVVPAMSSLPTGTVSFLFTDIEGSTELLQRIGDRAYKGILEEHHRLMRAAFEPVDGHEVDTQGDAFFVAFPEAGNAVAAAVDAQQEFASYRWPEGVLVRVRMGIHTGEPTLGPGGYVGIDVHRAARICSAGYGGQVLVSERTHAEVQNDLRDEVSLKDLGEHRLKDLARPEHIYQVVIPGLPANFPALKSLDIRITNLPALELTSFIGREREQEEIKKLLATARLVTLMGPGGAGKTRLALQVAADLIERFPKGVWLAELAPLSDPEIVIQTVAMVFGVREVPGRPLQDTLVDYLRTRELLLVLDNCEHLVQISANLAAALLRGCPKLKILATSREVLGTTGEATYRVPSLTVPDPRRTVSVDQLTRFDATNLFLERAALSNPHLVVTDTTAPLVAHISRRLDGIPLAIELAAARVKVLSVEQIAKRLDDRFRLLTGGSRGDLPHHQTLRTTVDWSYELLSKEERLLFRRLSVFAGGFSLEPVEAVCSGGGIGADDVLDLLARLVDKSLVVAESTTGDVRYRMLETIRQYSRERLQESGETDALLRRHLKWHLELAEQAAPHLQGPDQVSWLDRLGLDYDDFRAALEWVRAEGSCVEDGARLAGALHRFWALRGYLTEGREWLEGILSKGHGVSASARAKAAYGAGVLALLQGDYARSEALGRESLHLYRESGDTLAIALALNVLGLVARNRGDYGQARVLLEESLAVSRRAGHQWALAEGLNIAGIVARRRGDHAEATERFEESQALWRELGDKWGLAFSLGHLGVVARQQGDYDRARGLHEESLVLRRRLGDQRNIAAALSSLGVVALYQGDHEQAEALFQESLALSRELGDKLNIAATLCTLGLVVHRQGDDSRASALLQESLVLSRELGDKLNSAAALCNLGFVAFHRDEYGRAAALHRESLVLYRELGDESGIADCLMGRARVAAAQGQAELAARLLAAAEALRSAKGVPMSPSDRVDHERAVTVIRALLSEEAFAAAWARGQVMPLEEAIKEAMR